MVTLASAARRPMFTAVEVVARTLIRARAVCGRTINGPSFGARDLSRALLVGGRTLYRPKAIEYKKRGFPWFVAEPRDPLFIACVVAGCWFALTSTSGERNLPLPCFGVARGGRSPHGGLRPGRSLARARARAGPGTTSGTMTIVEPEPEDRSGMAEEDDRIVERVGYWATWWKRLRNLVQLCDWTPPQDPGGANAPPDGITGTRLTTSTTEGAAQEMFSLLARGSDLLSSESSPMANPSKLARAFVTRRMAPDFLPDGNGTEGRKLIVAFDTQFRALAKSSGNPDQLDLENVFTGVAEPWGWAATALKAAGFDLDAVGIFCENGLCEMVEKVDQAIASQHWDGSQCVVLLLWSGIDQFDLQWRHLQKLPDSVLTDFIDAAQALRGRVHTLAVTTAGGRQWNNHGSYDFAMRSEAMFYRLSKAGFLCTRGIPLMLKTLKNPPTKEPAQQYRAAHVQQPCGCR